MRNTQPSGSARWNSAPRCRQKLDPLFALLAPLNAQIRAADARIAAIRESDADVALLISVPGIGPVTATAVVAAVDDVTRFTSAHQFEAFLGWCQVNTARERSGGRVR